MPTREQLTAEKVNRLLEMIEQDGPNGSGNMPPAERCKELREIKEPKEGREIAKKNKGKGKQKGKGNG